MENVYNALVCLCDIDIDIVTLALTYEKGVVL